MENDKVKQELVISPVLSDIDEREVFLSRAELMARGQAREVAARLEARATRRNSRDKSGDITPQFAVLRVITELKEAEEAESVWTPNKPGKLERRSTQ